MIRKDYQSYFDKLKRYLCDFEIYYSSISEEELEVKFYLNSGWVLELDCERFGSSVSVVIKNPKVGRKEGYAIWILMRAFEVLKKKSFGIPIVENQIRFLAAERESIFQDPDFYEKEYANINRRPPGIE